MTGVLRLVLAIMVLVSHLGFFAWGLNPGVMAVVVFYLISGYVMAGLMDRHYQQSLARVGAFYLDRLMRIYPQYLVYALAALLAWSVGLIQMQPQTQYLIGEADWRAALNNLTIMPLNLFMFNGADQFVLVPPAWSLGAELMFYALAPFLWRFFRVALGLAIASVCLAGVAMAGLINPDWWAYRLLPGVLWIFLLGMLLFRLDRRMGPAGLGSHSLGNRMGLGLAALALLALVLLKGLGLSQLGYNREVLLGVGLGLPIFLVARASVWDRLGSRPGPWQFQSRLDQWCGSLSYGVFLNHFLIIWLAGLAPGRVTWITALWVVFASIGLSAASYWAAERPVLELRRGLRRKL